jgi:5-methylcytosine-specific restriction protein A
MCGERDCLALVRGAVYCEQHSKAWHGGQQSGRLKTAAYERMRQRVLGRAGYHCQILYSDICIGAATEADHIVPVFEGGTRDEANMQAACRPCHARKSSLEGHRAAGHSVNERSTP